MFDLLSDETMNREVLKWLKMWDPCVFGRKSIMEYAQSLKRGGWGGGGWQGGDQGRWGGRGGRGAAGGGSLGNRETEMEWDTLGRPLHHKVILIGGPPGLGMHGGGARWVHSIEWAVEVSENSVGK